MKRVPVVATVLVLAAVAAMIALGFWQLQRRQEKLALLALYAGNQHRPTIAMPATPDDMVLFRHAVATCREPHGWHRDAGRAANGSSGWRAIAQCFATPATAAFAVQVGIGSDPLHDPVWVGGTVSGYITHAPQHRALIEGLFSSAPDELMLVTDTPLPGLRFNQPASLDDIPNNHLAYAVQWFLFAAIAATIYTIALVRRRAPVVSPPVRG
ncbi:SURF1 family cytochrome oxidase biogenesis protein [Sphingomonas bacterium]|uniref:SURF1 family cytochrome oxidase biogenesis protein n=1 Tax=Sphingomonas bacterium TaxID=1895847 RepID=UPI00157694BA|nr:SURF1 family cytochrome oxidase biogenesis protein [Sphingomonas bacterium]